jgi:hypothetical protein
MAKKSQALRATNADFILRGPQLDLPFPPRKKTFRERFEENVDRSGGPLACHPWKLSVQTRDYGKWGAKCPSTGKRTTVLAHRVAYELAVGPIPDGMQILHSRVCITKRCCNPRHLRPGTQTENEADKPHQSRSKRLKKSEVLEIALRHQRDGASIEALAHTFNVGKEAIRRIVRGLSHSKVTKIDRSALPDGRSRKSRAPAPMEHAA